MPLDGAWSRSRRCCSLLPASICFYHRGDLVAVRALSPALVFWGSSGKPRHTVSLRVLTWVLVLLAGLLMWLCWRDAGVKDLCHHHLSTAGPTRFGAACKASSAPPPSVSSVSPLLWTVGAWASHSVSCQGCLWRIKMPLQF